METKIMWMQTNVALPLSEKVVLVCYEVNTKKDVKAIAMAKQVDEVFFHSNGKPMEIQPTHWAYHVSTP